MNLRPLLLFTILLLFGAAGSCVAQGRPRYSTDSLNFGVADPGCQTRQLVISAGISDTIRIDSIFLTGVPKLTDSTDPLPPFAPLVQQGMTITVTVQWCHDSGCLPGSTYLYIQWHDSGGGIIIDSIPIIGCTDTSIPGDSLLVSRTGIGFGGLNLPRCALDSFTISNVGSRDRSITLNLIENTGGVFGLVGDGQFQLAPDSSITIAVMYCPDTLDADSAMISVIGDLGVQVARIPLRGNGITPWSLAPEVRFPDSVELGECDTIEILIGSQMEPSLVFNRSIQELAPFTLSFSKDSLAGFGDSVLLRIVFCPDTLDLVERSFVITDKQSRPFAWLRVSGIGKVPSDVLPTRSVALTLDAASERVGRPIRLLLRAQPALEATDMEDSLRFVLTLEPQSLFFNGVESAATGWGVTGRRTSDTSMEITLRPDHGAAPAETPLAIQLTGLTTGSPRNDVMLSIDSTVRALVPISISSSIVLLEGCELGTDPRLSRRVSIQGLHFENSIGTTLRVDYRAPLHARAYLRLADVSGTSVQTINLPEGTDADATATIELQRLAPGLCVVELRAGDSRATTLMMVAP